MNFMIWVWLGACVLFGAVEAATSGLVCIWFVAGAVVALLASALGASPLLQAVLFAAVSAAALALTRPLVRKFTKVHTEHTNLDRVLGETGKVTETVDNETNSGAVYVDGKTWTARSADGSVIPVGERVKILKIEGVKLFVTYCEKMEVVK